MASSKKRTKSALAAEICSEERHAEKRSDALQTFRGVARQPPVLLVLTSHHSDVTSKATTLGKATVYEALY